MKRFLKFLVYLLLMTAIFFGYQNIDNIIAWLVPEEKPVEASMEHGWNLILVNSDYCIPPDYTPQLMELYSGEQVDERIYPDLQQMFDDMRALDIYPVVVAGYRSHEDQQRIMDQYIADFEAQGYSEKEAKELARDWVAIPGTSEHELGLAVDINQDVTLSTADQVYDFLAENAHHYGFILRYPPDKTEITGISNEPWHYRYVGREAAKEIYESGLCLEEYIAQLDS